MLFFVHMFLLLLSAIGIYGVILCSIPELLFTGSLIQHQLVTHLTLGIALRAVLDALRKPVDSKVGLTFWNFYSFQVFSVTLFDSPFRCRCLYLVPKLWNSLLNA